MVRKLALIALAVNFLAGCTEESPVVSLSKTAELHQSTVGEPGSFDEAMARIARNELPGFAGVSIDAAGTLVVRVSAKEVGRATPERTTQIRRRFDPQLRRQSRLEIVEHDFPTLLRWSEVLHSELSDQRVNWIDIAEDRNRIEISVNDPSAVSSLVRAARDAGIPTSAISVLHSAPTQRLAALTAYVRPLAGGLMITRSYDRSACTLGFVARVGTLNRFMTNSHCSAEQYSADGSVEYQGSTSSPSHRIGEEVADPPLSENNVCGLVYGTRCRFSDASLYSIDDSIPRMRGQIYRTQWGASGAPGSTAISPTDTFFYVSQKWAEWTDAPVGTAINKIGFTTGWTAGSVTRTCVQVRVLRCQWASSLHADSGDSGAGVFHTLETPSMVALHGLLWGASGSETFYSSLKGIELDFGLVLDVTWSPTPGSNPVSVVISGPETVPPGANCQFYASIYTSGDPSAFTITWRKDGTTIGTGASVSVASSSSFTLEATAIGADGSGGSSTRNVSVVTNGAPCNDF